MVKIGSIFYKTRPIVLWDHWLDFNRYLFFSAVQTKQILVDFSAKFSIPGGKKNLLNLQIAIFSITIYWCSLLYTPHSWCQFFQLHLIKFSVLNSLLIFKTSNLFGILALENFFSCKYHLDTFLLIFTSFSNKKSVNISLRRSPIVECSPNFWSDKIGRKNCFVCK